MEDDESLLGWARGGRRELDGEGQGGLPAAVVVVLDVALGMSGRALSALAATATPRGICLDDLTEIAKNDTESESKRKNVHAVSLEQSAQSVTRQALSQRRKRITLSVVNQSSGQAVSQTVSE
mmetsp:Transcript_15495/g.36924  ORF Transcript_15495/g.36924 Transcript_15495/m.36924 type:complete len:123 (+) Transcript_15495:185-553(+)